MAYRLESAETERKRRSEKDRNTCRCSWAVPEKRFCSVAVACMSASYRAFLSKRMSLEVDPADSWECWVFGFLVTFLMFSKKDVFSFRPLASVFSPSTQDKSLTIPRIV